MEKYKKAQPIPEERLKKYRDIYYNKNMLDYMPDHVAKYYQRVVAAGIEQVSPLNRDYLGAYTAPFSRDLENSDIAIVGSPVEFSTPCLTGTMFGPQALRKLSKSLGSVSDDGCAPFDMCRIIDYGEIDTLGLYELKKVMAFVEEHMHNIVVKNNVNTLIWGGEHTVTYAHLKAYAEKYGPLGLVQIDAHHDTASENDQGYPVNDGNWASLGFAEGLVDPERTIQIGMRGRSFQFFAAGQAYGSTIISADDVFDMGTTAVTEKALEVVGKGPTYFTFDVDSLCASECASGGGPEAFGLTWRQVYEITKTLRKSGEVNLVGADVMEYTPQYPTSHRDGVMIAGYSWHILCWLAEAVAARKGKWQPTEWPEGWSSGLYATI